MRNLWIASVLVLLSFSLSASEAAQEEPEGPQLEVLSSEAVYLGQPLADSALQQRLAERRASSAGIIDSYNVWPSFQNVKFKANSTITGHAYQICQNQRLIFGNLLYVFATSGSVDIRVQINLNKGGGSFTCNFSNITLGFWQLSCEADPRAISPSYYKATAKYTVTRGGNGSGKETAWFDLFDPC